MRSELSEASSGAALTPVQVRALKDLAEDGAATWRDQGPGLRLVIFGGPSVGLAPGDASWPSVCAVLALAVSKQLGCGRRIAFAQERERALCFVLPQVAS